MIGNIFGKVMVLSLEAGKFWMYLQPSSVVPAFRRQKAPFKKRGFFVCFVK